MTYEFVDVAVAAVLVCGFITGIHLMQKPRTALWGNRLGAACMLLSILFVLLRHSPGAGTAVWLMLAAGTLLGILLGQLVRMIQMPQVVALLNGLGGASSAVIAAAAVTAFPFPGRPVIATAALALAIGSMTFGGSMVAMLKLAGVIVQKSVLLPGHRAAAAAVLAAGLILVPVGIFVNQALYPALAAIASVFLLFGIMFAVRIGGADMPVAIAFLNSFSGIAAAVCGLAVNNILLAGVGALVGVAGMILTGIMCRAMNRSLPAVLGGFRTGAATGGAAAAGTAVQEKSPAHTNRIPMLLKEAGSVIIVPGYGMAISQAQQAVKDLIDRLEQNGKDVKVAIHPVAGRMPGHMNVLLAEVGIPYEKLHDLDTINPEFAGTDLVIAVGACDVINPAANTAEGTPIYGMPILEVFRARAIIICNLDSKPGYSGVDNTLYGENNVFTLWGNAADTVTQITAMLEETAT